MATDTPADVQFRMLMEKKTSEIFIGLLQIGRPRCPITMVTFPLGGGSWVAWKTSLPGGQAQANAQLKLIANNWESGRKRREVKSLKDLPDSRTLETWAKMIKNMANDEKFGFSLICGMGQNYQYTSNGDRAGVLEMFKAGILDVSQN